MIIYNVVSSIEYASSVNASNVYVIRNNTFSYYIIDKYRYFLLWSNIDVKLEFLKMFSLKLLKKMIITNYHNI